MLLKQLIIIGFKSFAEKTILSFNPGITAIVGPNGCGKSNIADAFRWVLWGEQSAKSMRGNKMHDVIFAGSSQRKPLNFAEVTIVLSDVNGALPIEYDEVSVTRRLHRNGDSEYFINRQSVRLKDVQSLLLDSGMGRNAFSIFEQGKIDQVINYGPLERRYIFEEASGILRFLQRKKEALRKLEQVDTNTSRVRDIHQEVEKQIEILEKQAEKARLYKENKLELESLEKALFVAKWEAAEKKRQEALIKESSQKQKVETASSTLHKLMGDLGNAKNNLEESEKIFRARHEEVFKTRSHQDLKKQENVSHKERLKELMSKEKTLRSELEISQKKRRERLAELQQTQQKQKDIENRLADLETTLKSDQEKGKDITSDVRQIREQQQKAQQDRFKASQLTSQYESELLQNKVRLENAQERVLQLKNRIEKQTTQGEELDKQIHEKKELLQKASEDIDKRKQGLSAINTTLQEVAEQSNIVQSELDSLTQEIVETKARQKALTRLQNELEGFSGGSKRLLQESENPKSILYKKVKGLYTYFSPKKGFENALASALRSYTHTLVADTLQDFHECLAFAQGHNLADFSLLCLEGLPATPSGKSSIEFFNDLNAIAAHFFDNVVMSESLEKAFSIHMKNPLMEIWTKDGLFIDRRRVVSYQKPGENNVFLRTAELKSIEEKLQEKEQKKITLDAAARTLQYKATLIKTEKDEFEKLLRKEEMKLVEITFALQRLNGDLEKIKFECQQIYQEIHNYKVTQEKLSAIIQDLEEKRSHAQHKAKEIQRQLDAFESSLEQRLTILKSQQEIVQAQQSAYQKKYSENQQLLHTINLLEVKDQQSQQHEKRLEEEILSNCNQQSSITISSHMCEATLKEIETKLNEVVAACSGLEKELASQKGKIEESEKKIFISQQHLKQHESDLYQVAMHISHQVSSAQSISDELLDRYQLTIDQAKALGFTADRSIDQTEKEIRYLRQALEQAGDVNMMSIEACDEHKARYYFLNKQIDDLTTSKQELVKIIAELDEESRKIFKKTFEEISVNFKKNFKILFNGGEADLQFTDTNDILEAGIEIIAKPPGKQMRSIQLLSGGEKCLTAMALLFAIFEVKPAPFCILDEIDAPLDDSNVERFATVVKQFIDKCQFIIITHNKRTMAIADVLFGVSMEEKGVSKILSFEFNKVNHETAVEVKV